MNSVARMARRFAGRPPAEWQAAVDRMSRLKRGDIASHLNAMAIRFARAAVYMERRYGCYGWAGDEGHSYAVKEQNLAVTKVRRALGFTAAKDDLTF